MSTDLDNRVEAVKKLLDMFRWERIAYMTASCIALIFVIASAVVIFLSVKSNPTIAATAVISFGGSGGVFGYSVIRFSYMFKLAATLVLQNVQSNAI